MIFPVRFEKLNLKAANNIVRTVLLTESERIDLMRLLRTIFLLAITVISMVVPLASAAEVCENFPVIDLNNDPEVKDVYQNWDYGYEVRIPINLFGYGSQPPAPNHGFGILISRSPKAYVWVDASYNVAEETNSLKKIADIHLSWACRNGTNCEIEKRTSTQFAGLKAEGFWLMLDSRVVM